jgi:hypothetical protein
MATPNSKDTLKEYCLRALGKPVIDINVDPDQCDDRVDEALQYYANYHMEGVERMYLKHKITAADNTRGESNVSTNVTDAIDNSVTDAWEEQQVWIPIPTSVLSVLRIFPLSDVDGLGMFSIKYHVRARDIMDYTSDSMVNYHMIMNHLDHLDHILTGEVPIRFNEHQNRIYLDMDWGQRVTEDQYIIIECYRKLDPTTYTDIYNDQWLKKYATALIKRQWGANLIKFNGVSMLGGIQLNGETIYTQADEEIKLLEESILNGYGLPADMMIG